MWGWFYHPVDRLRSVRFVDRHLIAEKHEVNIPHGGVEQNYGKNRGFYIQCLRSTDDFDENAAIVFCTENGWTKSVPLGLLCRDRLSRYDDPAGRRFMDMISSASQKWRILDLGGRARSGIDRRQQFPNSEVVVFDVLPGENVDVVGDAHELSRFFPTDHFDAIYSMAVFEHLLMPWVAVSQISRVLKDGGLVFIGTHQTLGMHDQPWDFWRFSDTAWDALFNQFTGFEIIERSLSYEQYIIPFICRPGKYDAERSCGYEMSGVLARKNGPCRVSWEVSMRDLLKTNYPE